MTQPVTLRPRASNIQGLYIVVGHVSKDEILEFCPQANVGAPEGAPYDLRWIMLPNGQHVADGEWIVKDGHGYQALSDGHLRVSYDIGELIR